MFNKIIYYNYLYIDDIITHNLFNIVIILIRLSVIFFKEINIRLLSHLSN